MQAGLEGSPQPGNDRTTASYRRNRLKKVIQGPPKSLCLPKLCELGDISSVLIVRQESPWDTYRRVATCEIAGNVIIAVRYSRSDRMKAIREYPKRDSERLIHIFESVSHLNILSVLECYIYSDSIFALSDNVPLTLAHLVNCERLYPDEVELASIMAQASHQNIACRFRTNRIGSQRHLLPDWQWIKPSHL